MRNSFSGQIKVKLLSLIVFSGLVLITIGASYQSIMSFYERQNFPPEGTFYSMDGYSLHLHCTGSGSPTIILESDLAYPAKQWYLVQRELSRTNRVCSYDRPGMGWSDPSPLPREGEVMVEELYRLLRKANIEDDLLFVGYRRGTWISRLFAYNYPELVKGIILIEPSDENSAGDMPSGIRIVSQKPVQALKWMPTVTWVGITRFLGSINAISWFTDPFERISIDARSEILSRTIYKSAYWTNAYDELMLIDRIEDEFRDKYDLNDLPTVILINPNTLSPSNKVDQQNIERISSNSMVLICDNCGSMPPITSPLEVVMAVQTLLPEINR